MENRIENTVCYKGFRFCKHSVEIIKTQLSNFKFAYIARDGSHIRIHIATGYDDKRHEGIILEITNRGIDINAEFTSNTEPRIETMTKDWEKLLSTHIKKSKEVWIFCDENI